MCKNKSQITHAEKKKKTINAKLFKLCLLLLTAQVS